MITIRSAQMAAFDQALREPLVPQFVAHLRSFCSGESDGKSDEELGDLVRRGFVRGDEYGLETVGQYCCLTEYLARGGPDFGLTPGSEWFHEVMRRTDQPPDARLKAAGLARWNQLRD